MFIRHSSTRRPRTLLNVVGYATAIAALSLLSLPTTVAASQANFPTVDAAVSALVDAERANTLPALDRILWPSGRRLVRSGDSIADQRAHDRFLNAYDQYHRIDMESPSRAILVIGTEDWPLPIPLVKQHSAWHFDTASAAEEILNRRIGRNELRIIDACRAYWEAQHEYAAQETLSGRTPAYAQRMRSHDGQHDGLYWPTSGDDPESPLGLLVAEAHYAGYEVSASPRHRHPFHGYYLRILTRQGEHAPGGKREYVVDGRMSGGFALIAYPEAYGETGVMSFMISQDGIIYEKNLGPKTRPVAEALNAFDPDQSWRALR